jgi:hypothetical protein
MLTTVEGIMVIGYALAALAMARALVWLALGAGVFVASSVYWRMGGPHPELLAGALDAGVCLAIYFYGRQRWEMWVWRLFQVMLLVNMMHLAGSIGIFYDISRTAYAITLEVMNWLVILLIAGTGILQRVGYDYGGVTGPWRGVRGVVHTLCEKRQTPPFTAAH